MGNSNLVESIRRKFQALSPVIDERSRRHWAAVEAIELGWGGVTTVALATGLSRTTITTGMRELRTHGSVAFPRIRRPGGGRKRLVDLDRDLLRSLETLLEPASAGEASPDRPVSPIVSAFGWTCKSTRRLAAELAERGHRVSERTVAVLLRDLGYSLQPSRRARVETTPVDRKAQLELVAGQVQQALSRGTPVVAVQVKLRSAGHVSDQADGDILERPDFQSGWESAYIDHDTALFAAAAIRRWWAEMGADRFPWTREMLIVADGAHSPRSRLWRSGLQDLANTTGIRLHVCHIPPCTFKWSYCEQRLNSFLIEDWRGRRQAKRQAIVSLISDGPSGKTSERAVLETTEKSLEGFQLDRALAKKPHFEASSEWNYLIAPRQQSAVS